MIRKQGWCVLSCITLITSPVSHFVLVDYEVIKSETLYECRCSWFVFGCEESSTRDLPTFARVIGLAKHRSKSNWERESRTRIACSFPTSESTDLSELPCCQSKASCQEPHLLCDQMQSTQNDSASLQSCGHLTCTRPSSFQELRPWRTRTTVLAFSMGLGVRGAVARLKSMAPPVNGRSVTIVPFPFSATPFVVPKIKHVWPSLETPKPLPTRISINMVGTPFQS